MRFEIDIPEHHYNNIMALDSVSLGRVPYKGIIMYAINAIKHGKVLEQEPKIVPIAEIKYDEDKLKELVDKAVLTVAPQEPRSEWERDHEILKAYSNGANEVLDKIRAEIEEIPADYTNVSDKELLYRNRVLDILDKYKAGSEGNNV